MTPPYSEKTNRPGFLGGVHKTVNPTYGYDHRSDFCNIYRIRKGSLV